MTRHVVNLGPGHIVLEGVASPQNRGYVPIFFDLCSHKQSQNKNTEYVISERQVSMSFTVVVKRR